MKILFLKQKYDRFGPYKSFDYKDLDKLELLNLFKSKTNSFETFLLFEADFKIIDTLFITKAINQTLDMPILKKCIEDNLNKVYKINEINFENYDIIWCRDPILKNIDELKKLYPKKLFVMEFEEHPDKIRHANEIKKYDLHLDHASLNFPKLVKLPSSISFPYPRCPNEMRNIFDCKNKDYIYIDIRDIIYYVGANEEKKCEEFLNNINKKYTNYKFISNIKGGNKIFSYQQVSLIDNDGYNYLSMLAKSKYFISISGRIGQSMGDALSLNCLGIGNKLSPNHKILCHPTVTLKAKCILDKVIEKIISIERNKELYNEILKYENDKLNKYYVSYPKNILQIAIDIKKSIK